MLQCMNSDTLAIVLIEPFAKLVRADLLLSTRLMDCDFYFTDSSACFVQLLDAQGCRFEQCLCFYQYDQR